MNARIEVRATREPWNFLDTISIRMIQRNEGRRIAVAQPIIWKEEDLSPGYEIEPAISFTRETAQQFMDELWSAGIRPTEGAGSVGQLAATQKHLEDMRALVFKTGKPGA